VKARIFFLSVTAAVAAGLAGEVYLSSREASAETDVRRLNRVGDDEVWGVEGTFADPPERRAIRQGPLAAPGEYFDSVAKLGYRFKTNLRALPGRLRIGGRQIYDVTYSTGRFGWRETPQDYANRGDVLFLGGAAIFGLGLPDEQTIPSRFAAAMMLAARSHNFGVPGWDAGVTLRLLESGGEKPELGELARPTKAFYFLAGDRTPDRGGACDYLATCEWIRGGKLGKPTQDAHAAAEAIVKIGELLNARYGIRLTVVSWNLGEPWIAETERELTTRGVDLVPVRNVLPGFPSASFLLPVEELPNADAASLLARYLADRLRG
jgi:hypothetical protein